MQLDMKILQLQLSNNSQKLIKRKKLLKIKAKKVEEILKKSYNNHKVLTYKNLLIMIIT